MDVFVVADAVDARAMGDGGDDVHLIDALMHMATCILSASFSR
jgi:hypothetical protein